MRSLDAIPYYKAFNPEVSDEEYARFPIAICTETRKLYRYITGRPSYGIVNPTPEETKTLISEEGRIYRYLDIKIVMPKISRLLNDKVVFFSPKIAVIFLAPDFDNSFRHFTK